MSRVTMKMKRTTLTVVLTLGFWLGGCEPSGDSNVASSDNRAPASAQSDATAKTVPTTPDKTVEITANDQMKFNLEAFQVAPGSTVELTLKNVGSMPKFSMGHNLVILKPSTDTAKFVEGAMTSAGTEYIPASMKNAVIAHTKLLGGGENDTIVFVAPNQKGDYPFICSFPGHYQVGMKGTMQVR